MVKNPPANAGDVRNMGSIPAWGRSPGGGHGNPLQYSCLQNPMDRGAWWAIVHRIAKRQTRLKRLNTHTHTYWEGWNQLLILEDKSNHVESHSFSKHKNNFQWKYKYKLCTFTYFHYEIIFFGNANFNIDLIGGGCG